MSFNFNNTWMINFFFKGIIAVCAMSMIGACNKPVAHFIIEQKDTLTAPASVTFQNKSVGAEHYFWDFGDGTFSYSMNPAREYMLSGHYPVILDAKKGKIKDSYQAHVTIHAPSKCLVLIQTSYGDMLVELFDNTPNHRDNFVKLVEEGFFQDLLFHRVIEGFMIQGGDPGSRNAPISKMIGSGGPGYELDAEITPENIHLKGALAAARTGDKTNPLKRSSGSQFYIVHGSKVSGETLEIAEHTNKFRYSTAQKKDYFSSGGSPQLDMEYTVFGRVVRGLEVLDAIASSPANKDDRPAENIWMRMQLIH